MEISEVKLSDDFYNLQTHDGYLMEKYRGKMIVDPNRGHEIEVEDIYDLSFEDLEFEDQRLALKMGWAWGVGDKPDIDKCKQFKAYLFRPKQYRFFWTPSRFPAYIGAFGSGKSLILCLKGIYLSLMYPGTKGLLMRATYPQLMDTTIATLFKIFSYFGWQSGKQYNHHISRKLVELYTGKDTVSTILYRPAKNEGENIQASIEDLQSLEIDWAGIDEIVGVDERVVMAVRNRVGRWGVIGKSEHRMMMVSGNPPSEGTWVHKRWYERKYTDDTPIQDPEEHAVFASSTYENKRNLPKDYIDALEASPDYWKQAFLYGRLSFIPPEGLPVYQYFAAHYNLFVSDKPLSYNPKLPILRGYDIGPTAKNKAVVIGQLDPKGVLIILAEFMVLDPGITRFGRYITEQCSAMFPDATEYRDIADPVAFHISQTDGKSPAGLLREFGINLIPGEESFQLRTDAVEQVMARFIDGVPGLLIDSTRCPKLTQGMAGGFRYRIIDEPNSRYSKEVIKDIYSHYCDALAYLCSRLAFIDRKKRDESRQAVRRRDAALANKRKRLLGHVNP